MEDRTLTQFHEPVPDRVLTRAHAFRIALFVGCALCAIVVVGLLCGGQAVATDFSAKMLPPGLSHPFGTDQMGRDMLARTIAGLSMSLGVGAIATCSTALLALAMAALSVFGGRVGNAFVLWLIDVVMGIPHIVLLILVSYALGRGFWGVVAGLSLTHWPQLARVLRAELLQLMREPYMSVSAALGVSRASLARRHIVPALLPQLLVGALLTFPHAILHEASITFLGFGLSPEQPALGVILAESLGYLTAGAWWLAVLPGAALISCVCLLDRAASTLRLCADVRARRGMQVNRI